MAQYSKENLFIITKTYPAPSWKYREISCVAAINQNGEMRRLFPIPFRLLDGQFQFKRWEWINAKITKAKDDHRPESYKVDVDSIERIRKVGTKEGWAERLEWITPHLLPNFDALENRRQVTSQTLGFIRPSEFALEVKPSDTPEWTSEEKAKLIQDGLFDTEDVKARIPLRKVPYDFYYSYSCETPTGVTTHKHKITDWEICALYWNCQREYGDEWESYFRKRLEEEFSQSKELIYLMGTMHRFPENWLIVGLIYPPKSPARQQAFLLPPSG